MAGNVLQFGDVRYGLIMDEYRLYVKEKIVYPY